MSAVGCRATLPSSSLLHAAKFLMCDNFSGGRCCCFLHVVGQYIVWETAVVMPGVAHSSSYTLLPKPLPL